MSSNLPTGFISAAELRVNRVAINDKGTSFNVWDDNGNVTELSLIQERGTLISAIDTSYLEQDIDLVLSPYNNGTYVFKSDDHPVIVYTYVLTIEKPMDEISHTLESHRQLDLKADFEAIRMALDLTEAELDYEYCFLSQVESTRTFID